MKIIINADDFGFSKSINNGIIEAYKKGLITTTTIMINMPYVEDAINLWKQNKKLGLGLHINITAGKPISNNVNSLVDENGNFYHHNKIEKNEIQLNYEDVIFEIKSQIEKLKSYDVIIDHLDCHHSIFLNDTVKRALLDIAEEYNLPMRTGEKGSLRDDAIIRNIITTDELLQEFYADNAKYETIINFIDNNKHLNTLEIMTHCGFIDEDTKNRTSYINREQEIQELQKLKDMGFYDKNKLITFKDLIYNEEK